MVRGTASWSDESVWGPFDGEESFRIVIRPEDVVDLRFREGLVLALILGFGLALNIVAFVRSGSQSGLTSALVKKALVAERGAEP